MCLDFFKYIFSLVLYHWRKIFQLIKGKKTLEILLITIQKKSRHIYRATRYNKCRINKKSNIEDITNKVVSQKFWKKNVSIFPNQFTFLIGMLFYNINNNH